MRSRDLPAVASDPGQPDALLSFEPEAPVPKRPEGSPASPAASAAPRGRGRALVMMFATFPAALALALAAVGLESLLRAPALPSISDTSPPRGQPGLLVISALPERTAVFVDGVSYGQAPVQLQLPPGSHWLQLEGDGRQRGLPVLMAAGATHYLDLAWPDELVPFAATMAEAPGAAGPVGLVSFQSPVGLEIREGSRVLGVTWGRRPLRLPVGAHTLELVNDSLEFRTTVVVDVRPAGVMTVIVAVPHGALTVTAVPWAEVTVAGRRVGRTPLGNLAVPIGTHEVVWRHPELGERRQDVTVKARSVARVGVDLWR
jgi:hypothetical protein